MSPSAPNTSTTPASSSSGNNANPDLSEIGHYVVTAHPPGSVQHSIKCSFLSPNSIDVVIVKSNRIEIRQYQQPAAANADGSPSSGNAASSSGLGSDDENLFPLMLTLPINGRILTISPIRFPSTTTATATTTTDCLFFTTEKGGYALISYDASLANLNAGGGGVLDGASSRSSASTSASPNIHMTGEHYPIFTHASGTYKNTHSSSSHHNHHHGVSGGRLAECGPMLAIDPLLRCIVVHHIDNYLTVIPVNVGYNVGEKVNGGGAGSNSGGRVPWRRNGVATSTTSTSAGATGASSNSLAGGSGKPAPKPQNNNSRLSLSSSQQALGDPFNVRLEERTLLSITFLEPPSDNNHHHRNAAYIPQIALLHQDVRENQHVTSHGIDLIKRSLVMNGTLTSGSSMMGAGGSNTNNPRSQQQQKGGKKSASSRGDGNNMPPIHDQLKISKVDGGSSCLIAVPPAPRKKSTSTSASAISSIGSSRSMDVTTTSSAGNKKQSKKTQQHHGGIIILGHRQITYHSTAEGITRIRPTGGALLLSYCRIVEPDEYKRIGSSSNDNDGGNQMLRYLLGDDLGRIHLLSLMRKDGIVTTMLFDTLGTSVTSSALVYLGKGNVFVGSQFGNSQLIKILDTPVSVSGGAAAAAVGGESAENNKRALLLEDTTYISVVEEYTNLGPIVDFDLRPCSDEDTSAKVEGGKYRQSLIATCSGVGSSGTVRLVRNGVGMKEHAAVDMEGIKGMWSLRKQFADEDDAYLVQSFVRETRMLGVQSVKDVEMEGEEEGSEMEEDDSESEQEGGALAEVTIDGFNSSKSTLFAGNLMVGSFDLLLQVVDDSVRLVDAETLAVSATWSPFAASDDESDDDDPMGFITVASANECGQIVVALRGGALVYLVVEGEGPSPTIRRVKRVTLDREISCVDLNPFGSSSKLEGKGGDTMDVDNAKSALRGTSKSQLVAVGLWDDFSVRLLNLGDDTSSVLDQVLHINLGRGNVNGGSLRASDADSDEPLGESGQHMMARSLCLVTMDSQSTSSNAITNKHKSSVAAGSNLDMLLVGLGDGKLISFVVNQPDSSSGKWSVHSRKEVSLGTQGIHLIPFQHGSSVSSGSCVLATGDRPTIVYLTGGSSGSNSNPKLNYSTISLTIDDDDEEEEEGHASHKNISVNVASPFKSSLLFSSASAQSSSLCVADENTLRLGVIDDIEKLHVTSYKLGMTPRRIAYHEAGRVYAVGCIAGWEKGGEANQNNCVRFFDDSTFEELSCIDLEPFEMILSIESVYLSINTLPRDGESRGRFKTAESTAPLEYRPFLVMGTAYAYPDEDEPSQGRVIVVECNHGASGNLKSDSEEDQMVRTVRQVVDLPFTGGIYSIAPFYGGNILVTCGSKTVVCQLASSVVTPGDLLLNHVGTPHHGHLISLYVKSLVSNDKSLQKSQEKKQLAIVGDLMRSISLVEYYPKHQVVEEVARDYNANYCTDVAMLTNNIYMGCEGFNNLFVLRYNPDAKYEQARCRLDTVGQYHLGEMANKMVGGSLIMPSNGSSGSTGATSNGNVALDKMSNESNRKVDISIGSQTLYGTVDGTIGSVLGLGGKTFAFLNALQRAMDAIVRPVGDLSRGNFRAWEQDQKRHGSSGFIDGDWIETFLDLNRPTMEKIVKIMNSEKKWKIRDDGKGFNAREDSQQNMMDTDEMGSSARPSSNGGVLSVEDVLAAVEELTMLH